LNQAPREPFRTSGKEYSALPTIKYDIYNCTILSPPDLNLPEPNNADPDLKYLQEDFTGEIMMYRLNSVPYVSK
jgi:hypothetical protein